jgi:hypothetical protein
VWDPRFSLFVVAAVDLALFTVALLPDDPRGRERAGISPRSCTTCWPGASSRWRRPPGGLGPGVPRGSPAGSACPGLAGLGSLRKRLFAEGKLPLLVCSPTMELGVDIARLNVVGLRRALYKAARAQAEAQHKVSLDANRSHGERKQAERLRQEALQKMRLLESADDKLFQSDFYVYRYFASEGFLPGYSFPRLPLCAYIPGRRERKGADEYVSWPRFLAISEFGPRNFIYHEGSRYRIQRSMLPVRGEGADGQVVLTEAAKVCQACGYFHPAPGGVGPDLCESCGMELPAARANLFRMQNVDCRRVDRINSDEEERTRQGYELRSAVRFAEGPLARRSHRPRSRPGGRRWGASPMGTRQRSGGSTSVGGGGPNTPPTVS